MLFLSNATAKVVIILETRKDVTRKNSACYPTENYFINKKMCLYKKYDTFALTTKSFLLTQI